MIQWNPETLEEANSVMQLLTLADIEWEKRRKLYERFRRKCKNSDIVSEDDKQIKIAIERYVTMMTTGYFAGKAPIYDVEKTDIDNKKQNFLKKIFNKIFNIDDEEELKTIIDYIAKYNDDSTEFFELAFDFFCMSACYEVIYENKNNDIVYTKYNPLNTIAIYDYSTPANLIGILRCWNEKDKKNNNIKVLELTTITGKHYYYPTPDDYNEYKEKEEEYVKNKWDDIPVIAIEEENGLACFELAISVIVAFERVMQNTRNTFQYNDTAKLVIKGYNSPHDLLIVKKDSNGNIITRPDGEPERIKNPAREQYDKAQLEAIVFYMEKDGDLSWVEKNIQDTALQNHKKTLIDLISIITGVPNITDLGFTDADNASALDRKFFALEQFITLADKQFKKGFLRRWEIIIEKINKKKHKNYDFRNIKIDLMRNLPTDKKTETDRALSLRSLLSDETIIDMLPDDLDSVSEINKLKQQEEENMNDMLKNAQTIPNNKEDEENKEEENINEEISDSGQDRGRITEKIQKTKQISAR